MTFDGRTVLVIGASGDVGRGIVRVAIAAGHRVVASARNAQTLEALFAGKGEEMLRLCSGDISTEAGAKALWDSSNTKGWRVDAVVVSVNMPNRPGALNEWAGDDLIELFAANVLTHFNAARVMLPALGGDGLFLGIGGGTAEFVIPGLAPLSIMQAALRMMYKGLALEAKDHAAPRELMIVSMINGESKRDRAKPDWLTEDEVGRHVCSILSSPDRFVGPVLRLSSREQVGQPEAPAGKR